MARPAGVSGADTKQAIRAAAIQRIYRHGYEAMNLRGLAADGRTILVSSHMLSEVEQTVDDVVIISNGQLVKSGTMADLHGPSSALVRTSDPSRLAGALRVADVTSQATPDGALLVETDDLRLVGDVALRAGVPIWQLQAQVSDLEDMFFRLTEGQNRNLGDATTAPREGDAIMGRDGGNEQ